MKQKLLTVAQAAKLLGVKRTNIYYYIQIGLPTYMQENQRKSTDGKKGLWAAPTKHVDETDLLAFYKKHRENNI